MYKPITYLLILILIWTGCSSPLSELPESQQKLVVQSEFKPDEPIKLYFFEGISMPVSGYKPEVPDSVDIKLKLNGEDLDVQRVNDEIPYYQVNNHFPTSGKEYKLWVSVPGNETIPTIRSSATIPYSDTIHDLNLRIDTTLEQGQIRTIKLTISLDISGTNNERYNELSVFQEAEGRIMPPLDTLWTPVSGDAAFLVSDEHILPVGIHWLNSKKSFLIDYYQLSDKRITLEMDMNATSASDVSRLRINLKSHTREGFDFILSYDKMNTDYYAEFPVLVSNIEDGIGIFTGYAETNTEVDFKNR